MKFLLKPSYWLGSFALTVPLLFLLFSIPFINKISLVIVWGISQLSFLKSIQFLTKDHELEIEKLKNI